ncbi:CueP family metal-binding protein [Propionibacteriaceae bacterium Y2011]|uniref:CueP family metal-binding protein n=1 Tax=Microlunatus sp. Y2014 TaxID=3418488 RepID=UPI003B451519
MPRSTSQRLVRLIAVAVLTSGIVLTGCTTASPGPASPPASSPTSVADLLADHGLAHLEVTQIIERLDAMPVEERPADLMASVRPDALVLTDGQERESRLPMPEDEVYVAVAPYRDQTHECYFHSLTTCLGELGNAEVRIVLTDADGDVLIDEIRRTFDNGFVGLWVPRGIEATLNIEHEGSEGSVDLSTTGQDDPTCITSLRLA